MVKFMKKLLITTFVCVSLISCSNSEGDSFGYTSPPPTTQQDTNSNEDGPLQQPGGVIAGIESEDGNPDYNSDMTIRE